MVIGKSLLGAGARIPCIRTRLQVKFLVSFHVHANISRTQQDTILSRGAGRVGVLIPALRTFITSLSELLWCLC